MAASSTFRPNPGYRDPVEHRLWATWFPVVAKWERRPYYVHIAKTLNMEAALFATGARTAELFEKRIQRWSKAQCNFIGDMEHLSAGAISEKLISAGEIASSELVLRAAAVRGPLMERQKQEIAHSDAELKRILSSSGLSTLLEHERYVPSRHGAAMGDRPIQFMFTQTDLFQNRHLYVENLYDPKVDREGIRLLVDIILGGVNYKRAAPYDARVTDLNPSLELFMWFGHDPEKWSEFLHYHHRQLHGSPHQVERFLKRIHSGPITLLHLNRGEHNIARSAQLYLSTHFPECFGLGV